MVYGQLLSIYLHAILVMSHFIVLDRTTEDGHLVLGFLVLLGFNVGCAFIAALLIAFEVSLTRHPATNSQALYTLTC